MQRGGETFKGTGKERGKANGNDTIKATGIKLNSTLMFHAFLYVFSVNVIPNTIKAKPLEVKLIEIRVCNSFLKGIVALEKHKFRPSS